MWAPTCLLFASWLPLGEELAFTILLLHDVIMGPG